MYLPVPIPVIREHSSRNAEVFIASYKHRLCKMRLVNSFPFKMYAKNSYVFNLLGTWCSIDFINCLRPLLPPQHIDLLYCQHP